ncbi:PAS domain S-box protein [Nitrospira sp. Kam-Ns4a]
MWEGQARARAILLAGLVSAAGAAFVLDLWLPFSAVPAVIYLFAVWASCRSPVPTDLLRLAALSSGLIALAALFKLRTDGSASFLLGSGTMLVAVWATVMWVWRDRVAPRARAAWFETFLDNSPVLAFLKDASGSYRYVNRPMERRFTRPRAEWLGKTDFDLFPPETARQLREHDQRVLETDTSTEMFARLPGQDGGTEVWWVFKFPVRDAMGRQLLGGLAIDLTQQKQIEGALEQAKEQYRQLFERSPYPMWILDADDFSIVAVNEAAARRYGVPRGRAAAVTGEGPARRPDSVSLHDYVMALVARQVRAAPRSPRAVERLDEMGAEAALAVEVEWAPVTFEGRPAYVAMAHDMGARRRLEEERQRRERRFRALIENASDLIVLLDHDGSVLFASPSVERVLGYTPMELIGRKARDLLHPDDQPAVTEVFAGGVRIPGHTATQEFRIRHRDGSWRTLEGTGKNLLHDPVVQGVIVNCWDITERVRAQLALRESKEHLRQSYEQIRALSAHLETVRERDRARIAREIHDELGQALTGIKLGLWWVRSRLATPGQFKPIAEQTAELAAKLDALGSLVERTIQTVQAIAAELRPPLLDEMGLPAAMEWQAREFQTRTGIETRFLSDLSHAPVDRERATALFRILQESLTNVLRHARATAVTVRLAREEDAILLEVRDNGVGIGESEIADVRSLGLLGMRERAELAGGTFAITGAPGGGTTVAVRIPMGEADEPARQTSA